MTPDRRAAGRTVAGADVPDRPLVSVVMPVYNGERFVAAAVESILGQTYPAFELIVVDDGSTDRTPAILDDYARRDPRVWVCRQERNAGFREALNAGCRLARGSLIARMDADDVSLPERLETQVAQMLREPGLGVVGSFVQIIDEHGREGAVKRYPTAHGLIVWSMVFFNSLAHPAVMMRREIVEAAGWYPDGCAGGSEDYALFIRLGRVTRMANIPEVLLQYRIWGGGMSQVSQDRQLNDGARILRESLRELGGPDITAADVHALYGLSTGRYPGAAAEARRIADLIVVLTSHFLASYELTDDDVAAIKRDAGVRLWLLAAVALRRSPRHALAVAWPAALTSPFSFWFFVRRVLQRLCRPR